MSCNAANPDDEKLTCWHGAGHDGRHGRESVRWRANWWGGNGEVENANAEIRGPVVMGGLAP